MADDSLRGEEGNMLARLRMAVALTGLYLAVGACTPIGNTILPSESLGSSGSGSPASNESSQSPVQAKIGSRVQVGTEQIHVVMKVETWKGSTFIKPEKGNVFVAALVKIQALETTTYNPFWYKVRGPDGFEYQPSIFGRDPKLGSSNTLQPGRTVQGWVTFEVPKAAASKLTMIYTPGFFTEEVEIRLY
ncbi:MAG TPA: DUF4352 domain-containing protein [Candidatus Dormibacteraeota bacterium]